MKMEPSSSDQDEVRVSVIIPVYNVEKYLRQCLDTVINQTLKGIEIIAVDDGSTDSCPSILNGYSKQHKNLKIIRKKNSGGGAGGPRNVGIEAARGEYIGFIDSDDWVELDMFETLYKKAIATDSDIVICDYKMYWQDKKKFTSSWKDRDRQIWKNYLNKQSVPFSTSDIKHILLLTVYPWRKIYKRLLIVENNIRFPEAMIFDDTPFHWKTSIHANKITSIDKALYKYRRERPEQDIAAQDKRLFSVLSHHENIRQYLIENGILQIYAAYLIRSEFITFTWILEKLQNELKREFFIEASKSLHKFKEMHFNEYSRLFDRDSRKQKEMYFMRSGSYDTYIKFRSKQNTVLRRIYRKLKL